jgi:Flp pilus assembly pilin Flp
MSTYFFQLFTRAANLRRDRKGQDLIEYALLAGFIGVAVAFFFPMDIAPNISGIMSKVSSLMNKV